MFFTYNMFNRDNLFLHLESICRHLNHAMATESAKESVPGFLTVTANGVGHDLLVKSADRNPDP